MLVAWPIRVPLFPQRAVCFVGGQRGNRPGGDGESCYRTIFDVVLGHREDFVCVVSWKRMGVKSGSNSRIGNCRLGANSLVEGPQFVTSARRTFPWHRGPGSCLPTSAKASRHLKTRRALQALREA